uniref:Armadillo repeat-containing domain-containing protein n=1 Tax=Anguilla anguilla TaxID=7936 RepID=A0A0E9WMG8_ANGAN
MVLENLVRLVQLGALPNTIALLHTHPKTNKQQKNIWLTVVRNVYFFINCPKIKIVGLA